MVARAGSLHCHICIYDNTIPYAEKGHCRHENSEYVRTSEELLQWLETFQGVYNSRKKNEAVYPSISFMSLEPLKLGNKVKPNTPVVCKRGNQYLSQYEIGRGYTFSSNADEAIIFESEEDFQAKMTGRRIDKYRLTAPPDKKPKPFVIAVTSGCYNGEYVEKLSRSRLHLCRSSQYARSFAHEKEAQKYIDEKLAGRFTNCKDFTVVKREELAKEGA
jgi:hypothetical protein